MKTIYRLFLSAVTLLCATTVLAAEEPEKVYIDAQELRIVNKGFIDTEGKYERLPKHLKDSARADLWNRQSCSAGIAIRFATNSPRIGVKYKLTMNAHMLHMADTGIKGTDLYIYDNQSKKWDYVNTNRPRADKETKMCEATYVSNMNTEMKECMIYLPLYDGVEDLWVVIDKGSQITSGDFNLISSDKKIVFYGTSILQGGCASRTGMVSTSELGRDFNCEAINLGFSGEGKMDFFMAREMAKIPDVAAYVLDPVPNCTEMMCDTLTYDFVKILRTARPEVPIIMVEGPMYPYCKQDQSMGAYLPKKNEKFRKNYEKLKAENPNNLYYVTYDAVDGGHNDGTVDGIHLTDLGFKYYTEGLRPILSLFAK